MCVCVSVCVYVGANQTFCNNLVIGCLVYVFYLHFKEVILTILAKKK